MRTLVLLLAATVLLGGCGEEHELESPPQASQLDGCTTENFARTGTPVGTLHSNDRPVQPSSCDACGEEHELESPPQAPSSTVAASSRTRVRMRM